MEFDFSNVKFVTDEELEIIRQKERKEAEKNREVMFDRLVPKGFRDTDPKMLKKVAVTEAREWSIKPDTSPLNLLIHGTTGAGKTRLAWLCLRRRYISANQASKAIGAESFTRRLLNEKHLMAEMVRLPLLLLDDIGKERATPTAEASLFELIRERMDNLKPTIYTTNYTNDEFTKRFNHPHTGTAITRRLNDTCKVISM